MTKPATAAWGDGGALPHIAVIAASVLWGLWWLPLRSLEANGLTGDWVSVAVYGAGALGLLPFALAAHRRVRDGGVSVLISGLLLGLALAFWNHAILVGEVVRVTLLFYLAPIWATILGAVVLKDRITLRRALSILLGLGGAATVLGQGGSLPLPSGDADWLALASGVSFAGSTTVVRKARTSNSLDQSFVSMLAGAVIAWALAIFHPATLAAPEAADLPVALVLAAALGILWLLPALWLLVWGARRLDPGRVAILLLLEVVTAAASAAALTDEPFGQREVIGCLLITSAGFVEAGRRWPTAALLRRTLRRS